MAGLERMAASESRCGQSCAGRASLFPPRRLQGTRPQDWWPPVPCTARCHGLHCARAATSGAEEEAIGLLQGGCSLDPVWQLRFIRADADEHPCLWEAAKRSSQGPAGRIWGRACMGLARHGPRQTQAAVGTPRPGTCHLPRAGPTGAYGGATVKSSSFRPHPPSLSLLPLGGCPAVFLQTHFGHQHPRRDSYRLHEGRVGNVGAVLVPGPGWLASLRCRRPGVRDPGAGTSGVWLAHGKLLVVPSPGRVLTLVSLSPPTRTRIPSWGLHPPDLTSPGLLIPACLGLAFQHVSSGGTRQGRAGRKGRVGILQQLPRGPQACRQVPPFLAF